INRLAVFDHRCLRQLAHIKWTGSLSNVAVRRRVFRNARDTRSIGQLVTLHSLQCLGHVLRIPAERLPHRALYTEATNSWLKPRGGQAATWSRNMMITLIVPLNKLLMGIFARVNAVSFAEDIPLDEADWAERGYPAQALDDAYILLSNNCFIAAGIYGLIMIICGVQFYFHKRASHLVH
ncbi:uncharacterized protein DEA37_0001480, partial [Paragonimus westermani]